MTPDSRDRASWWAGVLYGVLTLLLAYPLWLHPASRLTSPAADTDLTMWALAWDVHAFTHQVLAIFDANIYYPQHLTLAYSENFIGSALLAAPALWLTGNPVLAFNLVALVSPALCGLGAFLLARSLRVSVAGAMLAGIVFAFSPPRFLRIDQLHLAPIQWIPFCLAYLVRYLDDGRPRDLRIAAGFFTLQALTTGHGAVFLVVAIVALAVRRLLRGDPIALGRRVRDLGAIGVAALAPTVLMVVPYLTVQREMGLRRTLSNWWTTWPSFLASPSHVDAWLLSLLPNARINENADAYLFPGILPILLACAAVVWWRSNSRQSSVVSPQSSVVSPQSSGVSPQSSGVSPQASGLSRPPDTLYAALLTGIALWVSVGPPIGLWPLVYWLPGFNLIRMPSRFMLLAVLGLAMLAGIGFDRIAARLLGSRHRAGERRGRALAVPVFAVVVGALLVAEFAAMPFETTAYAVDPPAIDRWLATRPGSFAIAEVPLPNPRNFAAWERRESIFMLHSTAHWQKTVHGYSGFRPPLHEQLFETMTTFPSEASIRSLTDLSVTYVVVHTDLYRPGEWEGIEKAISATPALKLEHVEGAGRVYSLPR